jgi:hypothetical protein
MRCIKMHHPLTKLIYKMLWLKFGVILENKFGLNFKLNSELFHITYFTFLLRYFEKFTAQKKNTVSYF